MNRTDAGEPVGAGAGDGPGADGGSGADERTGGEGPAPGTTTPRPVQPVLARALDHLLGQHPNARRRLAAHAGRQVRMGFQDTTGRPWPGLGLTVRIGDAGRVSADGTGQPDAEIHLTLRAATFSAVARGQARSLLSDLRLEGDPLLAGLVAEILGDLRWDAEDDLAALVGDVPARRLAGWIADVRAALADSGARAAGQARRVGIRAMAGNPLLAPRAGFEALEATLSELGQRLDALEARMRERAVPGGEGVH
jgi:ubiquinone biosynthesis protein UbiJ